MLPVLAKILVDFVLTLLVTVGVPMGLTLLHRKLKKAGLDLAESEQYKVDEAIRQAILEVEELVRAQVKAGLPATSSADKLAMAVQKVQKAVPALSSDVAKSLIHAALSSLGLGAAPRVSRY